ncbi:hypothetical protein Unana1_01169 [Umbelopsis nana]
MNKWKTMTDIEVNNELGEWATIPTTYAGGGSDINDLELVDRFNNGKVDLTVGT